MCTYNIHLTDKLPVVLMENIHSPLNCFQQMLGFIFHNCDPFMDQDPISHGTGGTTRESLFPETQQSKQPLLMHIISAFLCVSKLILTWTGKQTRPKSGRKLLQ